MTPAMKLPHSKSALLYDHVKSGLNSGRYTPGERLDPAALARQFRTSQTPVRFALYRLMGEGLLDDHARDGLHVPLPTELALRDLYDWMQRLLTMACDIGFDSCPTLPVPSTELGLDDDSATSTQRLFDGIALATGHLSLHRAVQMTNGRLSPIRHAKAQLMTQAATELADLYRHWQQQDMPALRAALIEYHQHRKRLVPRIVASLRDEIRHARY